MATTLEAAQDALERLCNVECMIAILIKGDNSQWEVNEALRGVARLLDGCYVALGEAIDAKAEATP